MNGYNKNNTIFFLSEMLCAKTRRLQNPCYFMRAEFFIYQKI